MIRLIAVFTILEILLKLNDIFAKNKVCANTVLALSKKL